MNYKQSQISNSLKGKFTNLLKYLFLLIIFFFVLSLVKNIAKSIRIRKQINYEKEKLEVMRKENEELARKLTETQSQSYIEKQLRDKLGMAKDGEVVLVLPDKETLRKLAPKEIEEEETLPDPNWKKWLKLFI